MINRSKYLENLPGKDIGWEFLSDEEVSFPLLMFYWSRRPPFFVTNSIGQGAKTGGPLSLIHFEIPGEIAFTKKKFFWI